MNGCFTAQKMQLCSTPHHGERNKDRGLLMTTANHPMSHNIMVINMCAYQSGGNYTKHSAMHDLQRQIIASKKTTNITAYNMQLIMSNNYYVCSSFTEAKRYKMPKRNRGIVLIFVNIKFKPNTRLENRERARIHTAKLESCWEKLGYSTIIVREDCTAFEITTEFKKRAKQASDDGFHSFVCCISSHGTDGLIKGSDGGDVKIEDLTKLLAEDEVKNLRNKPKMFFIQACRGYETPAAIPYDGRGDKLVSTDSDFFFGFATTPQRAAARDWYIPELCQTLESNYTQHDLLSMHTMVHDSVIDNHYDPNPDRKYKQQPQVVHMLRKQVWFNGP